MRQWKLRQGVDWRRAHQKVRELVLATLSAAGLPRDGVAVDAAVAYFERSVVMWRLRTGSAEFTVPHPKEVAERLALPSGATATLRKAPGEAALEVRVAVRDDATAEALAAFLRMHSPESAKAVLRLEIKSIDPPAIAKVIDAPHPGLAEDAGEASSVAQLPEKFKHSIVRLLVARERLEEAAMEKHEVGSTHDLAFENLVASARPSDELQLRSKVVALSVRPAFERGQNRLRDEVLKWRETGAVYHAQLEKRENGSTEVKQPPRGTLLMMHGGKIYFCADPLHYVLADYADQEGTPMLKEAKSVCLKEWSFERDAWQLVAREPAAGPRRCRPASAQLHWLAAYPKSPTGRSQSRGALHKELPGDPFKGHLPAGAERAANVSNLGGTL